MGFNLGGSFGGAASGAMAGSLFGPVGMGLGGALGGLGGGLLGGDDAEGNPYMLQLAKNAKLLSRDYAGYYRGLLQSLPGQAVMPLSQYTNEAAGNVAAGYDRARGIGERNLSRLGINPASGRWQGLMANLARSEAAGTAGALTAARTAGRLDNWNRQTQAAGLGLQMMGMGQAGLGQAAGLANQGAYLNMAQSDQQYGRLNDMAQALLMGASMLKTTPSAGGAPGMANPMTNFTSWLTA